MRIVQKKTLCCCIFLNSVLTDNFFSNHQVIMANRGTVQRPNGTQGKICQFKLVLLGESAVGKSSLVLRFVKGQFHEYQESTIGGKYKIVFIHPNKTGISHFQPKRRWKNTIICIFFAIFSLILCSVGFGKLAGSLNIYLFSINSCISNTDCLSGRHDCEIWDLGHGRTRTLPQSCSDVLSRSPGCYRRLWYTKPGRNSIPSQFISVFPFFR